MKAHIGDRILIDGIRLGKPCRVGVIIGVGGPDGDPALSVRWLNGGHTTLILPNAKTRIETVGAAPAGR